ncbi:hypothetical protein JOQ06_004413 [Pogonophryne albipinna]|uniref:Cytochrome P450 2K1-like n=1 Tax=Pogonophryne albipinna TaxID=1090488 RepID=A0AAD6APD8_9TELE|nr:hypothetical protein JOQ06_004413 [Pogonophryne albipinna]
MGILDIFLQAWSTSSLLMALVVLMCFYILFSSSFSSQDEGKEPPGPKPLPFLGNLLQLDLRRPYHTLMELSRKYGSVFTIYMRTKKVVVLAGYKTVKEALVNHAQEDFGMGKKACEDKIIEECNQLIGVLKQFKGEAFDTTTPICCAFRSLLEDMSRRGRLLGTISIQVYDMFSRFFKWIGNRKLFFRLGAASRKQNLKIISHLKETHIPQMCRGFVDTFLVKKPNLEVQEELSRVIGPRQVQIQDRKNLHFVNAVLHEIQRLANIAPISLPHKTSQGATVTPLLTSVLYDESEWENPHSFYPAHFLDKDGRFVKRDAFMPFSAGLRACPGESLAKMELFLFFTSLLQYFRFTPAPEVSEDILDLTPCMRLTLDPVPHKLYKVKEELSRVIGSRQAQVEDRKSLPFTDAVIHETQRLASIVPMALPHKTSQDVTFQGHFIKKGTTVYPLLTSILCDETEWEHPRSFYPAHFPDKDGKFIKRDAFMPFSAGRRVCLGESLARMELFIFFTSLLQHFRFTPAPGVSEDELDLTPRVGFTLNPSPHKLCAVSCDHLSSQDEGKEPPGPKPLPIIGNLLQIDLKRPYHTFLEFSKTYGSVFTVYLGSKKVVVLAGYKTVKEALVNYAEEFGDRATMQITEETGKSHGVVFSNGESWKEMRRFALTNLRDFGMGKRASEDKIIEECTNLIEVFNKYKDQVQEELSRVIGSRQAQVEDRKSLPFTDAVIHETQRLANIVPMAIPHKTSQDVTFQGHFIKKGTTVYPLLTSVLCDETEWEHPRSFYPAHFLDKDGKFIKRDAFMPFSAGRRVCLGESLARMELFIFFTSLLQHFRFTPAPGVSEDELDLTPRVGFTLNPSPHKLCAVSCEQ